MGDIGCLGTKTKLGAATLDAYHVFAGGGFGKYQAVGRQVFTGVVSEELPQTLETMLLAYLANRRGKETFQQFTARHKLKQLQEIFTLAQ